MTPPAEQFAGIDVSKDTLDVHIHPAGESFTLARSASGLEELVRRLKGKGLALIVLEATGGFEAMVVASLGRPMGLELLMAGCTVTTANSQTRNLPVLALQADIVAVAVGKPNLVKGEWIQEGATVVDVGINRLPDGRLCGDVEFPVASERASWITPVPGGVGPIAVASLLQNTLQAYDAHTG